MAKKKIEEIKDRPCPACRANGRDESGNHMMIFEDGGKFCNRCKLSAGPDNKIISKGDYEYEGDNGVLEDAVEFGGSSGPPAGVIPFAPGMQTGTASFGPVHQQDPESFDYKDFRDICRDVRRKYGVTTEESSDSLPLHQYYPITIKGDVFTWKKRIVATKDFVCLQKCKGKEIEFFGQRRFGGERVLIITEGEEDCMAAWQMLKGKAGSIAVVSLPFGANLKCITDQMFWIKKFKEVVLCFDQDQKGKDVTKDTAKLLPDAKCMIMAEKDANDMLTAGREKEFINDYFRAEKYKPASIILAKDATSSAMERPTHGLDYPFAQLTKLTYGFRPRRVIGIGAAPGAGKTCFVKAIQKHLMYAHKLKIGIASLEETPGEALRELAGYVMGLPLDKPDTIYNDADLDKVLKEFEDKAMIYDNENYEDFDDVEEAIRYMAHEGSQCVFIDPLSALTAHLSSSEANEFLGDAMWRMSKMSKQLDITLFHVNHLNNPPSGKDHGAGGKVFAGQFTGSKAMWRFSTDIWGLERDQYNEDEDIKNTSKVVMLKYRKPSTGGSFDLKYDKKTGTLNEHSGGAFTAL